MSAPNRRDVLVCLACTCALACVPLPGDTGDTSILDTGGDTGTSNGIAAGNVADYRVGDLEAVGHGVAIGLDADGFFALSTVCTHAGCDMANRGTVSGSGLVCSCHGSRFRVDGTVSRGPARRSLPFYAVTIDENDDLFIDKGTQVDPEVRVQPTTAISGS